jgi:hypothetical protein
MTTYCILNPNNTDSIDNKFDQLSPCGIKILMNKDTLVQNPDVIIFLKGTIYNLDILRADLKIKSDTTPEKVIIHLYKKYGIEYTLQVLDGIFTFILFDYYYEKAISNVYIVKDLFGIIPLYCFTNNKTVIFTEERIVKNNYIECLLENGSYILYELGYKVSAEWKLSDMKYRHYFLLPLSVINSKEDPISLYELSVNIKTCLKSAVFKMASITSNDADIIVEKLLSQIEYKDNDNLPFQFSPENFLIDPSSIENMFEYDYITRNRLYSTIFEKDKIYPFYDRSFIQLYFSIPLHLRYNSHNQLFSIDNNGNCL